MADTDERTTPQFLFEKLHAVFHFDLDAAATALNAKCPMFLSKEVDALRLSWDGWQSVFVNPPYSRGQLIQWVRKAASSETRTVMLLPGDISTGWFHEACALDGEMLLCKGRFRFGDNRSCAKFGTIVATFGWSVYELMELQKTVPGILLVND